MGNGELIMEKGFILVDVPETCLECRFCVELHEGIQACCVLVNNQNNHDEFKEIDVSYTQGKPKWCPIRQFPEKKEPSKFPISPILPWQHTDYEKGWNHCLDYLEGKYGNL